MPSEIDRLDAEVTNLSHQFPNLPINQLKTIITSMRASEQEQIQEVEETRQELSRGSLFQTDLLNQVEELVEMVKDDRKIIMDLREMNQKDVTGLQARIIEEKDRNARAMREMKEMEEKVEGLEMALEEAKTSSASVDNK